MENQMRLIANSRRQGAHKEPVIIISVICWIGGALRLWSSEHQWCCLILRTLTQDTTTNDWAMDVNMDECGITPSADNASIYFPLTIQAETDSSAIIYRETPGFRVGFKCYFQREMKFSGGGWKVTAENITDVTLGMVNHCWNDLDWGHFWGRPMNQSSILVRIICRNLKFRLWITYSKADDDIQTQIEAELDFGLDDATT